jgi:hypothetical protein
VKAKIDRKNKMGRDWPYVGTHDRKMDHKSRLVLPRALRDIYGRRNPGEEIVFYARREDASATESILVLQDTAEEDFANWFLIVPSKDPRFNFGRADPDGVFKKRWVKVKGDGERITIEKVAE